MKKRENLGKWASVFVVAVFLATTVTVNAIPGLHKSTPVQPNPPYLIVWDREYWDAMASIRVATDTLDNVVVVGTDGWNGTVVKRDSVNGQVIWDAKPTELSMPVVYPAPLQIGSEGYILRGLLQQMEEKINIPLTEEKPVEITDVATDSQNNVIILAMLTDVGQENQPSDVYVLKLNGDNGEKIWCSPALNYGLINQGMGVAVDSQDNIFVVGFSLSLFPIPHIDGWVNKLWKNNGLTIPPWPVHNAYENPSPWYWGIDVDSHNNVFVAGGECWVNWTGGGGIIERLETVITKYGGAAGLKLDEIITSYEVDNIALSVAVDRLHADEVVVAGTKTPDNDPHGGLDIGVVMKFNKYLDLQTLWRNPLFFDCYFEDVAVMPDGTVAATGTMLSGPHTDDFYTQIFNGTTGYPKTPIFTGGTSYAYAQSRGIAADHSNDRCIVVTGFRYYYQYGAYCMYTVKYSLTGGGLVPQHD